MVGGAHGVDDAREAAACGIAGRGGALVVSRRSGVSTES